MKSANPRHWDFYKRFSRKMNRYNDSPKGMSHKFREILLAGPDLLHLAICLVSDKDVPKRFKLKLAAVIVYFISPIDLLPELIFGPIGYADDIAILAYVLNGMLNQIDQGLILRYWAGESDVLVTIKKITSAADRLLGKGLLKKLKKSFGKD